MKKKSAFFAGLLMVLTCRADEGMWIPSLLKKLNEQDLKAKGLKISVEELYATDKSSLKDGIVHFGGGCTGEIISYEGLLLTNHHCGLSYIQSHSSLQHDYLKNGFWAGNRGEELSCPGLTISIITRMEDVTAKILSGVDMSTSEGARKIRNNMLEMEKKESEGNRYKAEVLPFNYGNAYFLIVKEVFTDIRLVGAPPQSVGSYGFDTDNWMWPRHTADFSMFRIYADRNNEPASYSAENKPYKPRFAFSINMDGVKEGDFTMVYGFPGRTQQFLTSFAVEYIQKYSDPARIHVRDKSLEIMDAAMHASDEVRIQYAAKQSRISNAHKKWKGELLGLNRLGVLEKKKSAEAEFASLLYKDPILRNKYGNVIDNMAELYKSGRNVLLAYDYFNELVFSGPEILRYANGFKKLVEEVAAGLPDSSLATRKEKYLRSIDAFYRNYNEPTDRALFAGIFPLYVKGTDSSYIPSYLLDLRAKYKNDWNAMADDIYRKSIFAQRDKIRSQVEKLTRSNVSAIEKDPVMQLSRKLFDFYEEKIKPAAGTFYSSEQYYMQRYVEGLAKVYPDRKMWYDANGTLRVAWGEVQGSKPRDGMYYAYYSTSDGILEKYYTGNADYDLPEKLVNLFVARDFGQYAKNGELRTCFTASNHTTGGNSGSPVINGYGELIGINFDRSWESTMSDIYFSEELCRNIVSDIRYILFIIDKLGGAGYLLNEMDLVTAEKREKKRREGVMDKIREINEQLMVSPDNAALLADRAAMFLNIGMWDDAKMSARAALDSKDRYIPAVLVLTEAQYEKGEYDEALKVLESRLRRDSRNNELLAMKARVLFAKNAFSDVLKTMEALEHATYEYAPGHEERLMRAKSYFMTGQRVRACIEFEKLQKEGVGVAPYYLEDCR